MKIDDNDYKEVSPTAIVTSIQEYLQIYFMKKKYITG